MSFSSSAADTPQSVEQNRARPHNIAGPIGKQAVGDGLALPVETPIETKAAGDPLALPWLAEAQRAIGITEAHLSLLKSGKELNFDFGVSSAWWDADLQRELIRGRMVDYEGGAVSERIEGNVILVADVLGTGARRY